MAKPVKSNDPFSEKNVANAILRVPMTSSKALRNLAERARKLGLNDLEEACASELTARGKSPDLTASDAELHAKWAEAAVDLNLEQAIIRAFAELPPRDYENKIIKIIYASPVIAFSEVKSESGRRDASLIIGHLVYDRFGFFRKWILSGYNDANVRQSNILIRREETPDGIRYWLQPEFETAMLAQGVV